MKHLKIMTVSALLALGSLGLGATSAMAVTALPKTVSYANHNQLCRAILGAVATNPANASASVANLIAASRQRVAGKPGLEEDFGQALAEVVSCLEREAAQGGPNSNAVASIASQIAGEAQASGGTVRAAYNAQYASLNAPQHAGGGGGGGSKDSSPFVLIPTSSGGVGGGGTSGQ